MKIKYEQTSLEEIARQKQIMEIQNQNGNKIRQEIIGEKTKLLIS